MRLTLRPGKAALFLAAIALFLALVSLTGQVMKNIFGHDHLFGLVPAFDVDSEANIPTWFASNNLLICSLLLFIIARSKKKEGDRYTLRWYGLAFVFAFLSLDEAAGLHELLILPLQSAFHLKGYLFFAWVIPYGLALLVFGISYLKFLFSLPKRTRILFFLAGGIFTTGALGLEILAGPIFQRLGENNMLWAFETALEELLEMQGVILFIYALLSYMALGSRELVITTGEFGQSVSPANAVSTD